MDEMIEMALYIVGFILIALIAMLVARHVRAKTSFTWQEAANKLGLNYAPPSIFGQYEMNGKVGEWQCRIHTYTVNRGGGGSGGSGNSSRTTYTEYKLMFPQPLNLGLRINRTGFFGGFAKMLGGQDIQVDYQSDFDKMLTIKGNDENEIKDFLTPERKEKIMAAYHFMPDMKIDDGALTWTNTGVERDSDSIVDNVTQLADLAGELTSKDEVDSIFY